MKTIELNEAKNGFSERNLHSKAILNTDKVSLLNYKIQKNRLRNGEKIKDDFEKMKVEFHDMKNELMEIKQILLKLSVG